MNRRQDLQVPCELIPGLEPMPVIVTGDWLSGTTTRWEGLAQASEPIAALVILVTPDAAVWSKSERPSALPLSIALALFPLGAPASGTQVNLRCHGGYQRCTTQLSGAQVRTDISPLDRVTSGKPWRFITVPGDPDVSLYLLFISGSQLILGRTGLWRLRPLVAARVPAEWRSVLTRARAGTWPPPECL
jgi:hypothetical protein